MERMISACSQTMSDCFLLATTSTSLLQDLRRAPDKRFSWQSRCQTPVRLMSSLRRTVTLLSANSSVQIERSLNSSGARLFSRLNEAKSVIFPLQLGTTHTRYVKHRGELRMNRIIRWIHAQKHLPCLIGSVTFSGLSCLPDMMEREGSEEERHEIKSTTDYS